MHLHSMRTLTSALCSSSLEIIDGYFNELLEEQDFLAMREQWTKMLALVPKNVASELDKEWQENCTMTSTERWRRLKYELRVRGDRSVCKIEYKNEK